jgi:hypothetical protein
MHSVYVAIFYFRQGLSIFYSQLSYHRNRPKNVAIFFYVMAVHLL